jgi:molybdopterin-guanine dinucleotide biosynthesis protein A
VAFIFGGDMPWLSEEIITGQARDFLSDPADILVPRLGDLPEPLHSVWSCSLHEQVKRYLESGGSPAIIDFFRLVRTRFLMLERTPETLKAFTNINNPGDIPKAS